MPRSTQVDMAVLATLDRSSADDSKEDLQHAPMTAYMVRLPWIEYMVDAMLQRGSHAVKEDVDIVQVARAHRRRIELYIPAW